MTWILQHLHYVHSHRRRKGQFLAKKFFYLVSSGKNEISPFLPILQIFFGSPGKFYYCPPRYTTLDWSWTFGEPQCFDQVRLNYAIGSASIFGDLRWKYFFGLHIKSLIDLKMFGATLGIGGAIAPSPGYAPELELWLFKEVVSSYDTRLQQWICKPLMFPWFNHR